VKGSNSTNEWSFTYFNGQLCFNRQGLANLACAAAPAGGFHHYAATYAAGTVVLYVDGAAIATASGKLIGSPANSVLNVGAYAPGDTAHVVGRMNDIALWGRALTGAQVQALYSGAKAPSAAGNLVAEWRLEDGSGTTAADSSGNGHDMALTNVGWGNTCYNPLCGNGVVDPGEGCDLGSKNSDNVLSACDTECRGTGIVALFDASNVSGNGTAPANGAPVATWVDLAHGHNAVQTTAAQQPTYVSNAINGQPGLLFNSSSNAVLTAPVDIDYTVLPAVTVVAVFQNSGGSTSYSGVWGQDDGGYDRLLISGGNGAQGTGISSGSSITPVPGIAVVGAPLISVAALQNGAGAGTSSVYLNGTLAQSFAESHSNSGTHQLSIGNINGPPAQSFGAFQGVLSLLAIFDHALTPAEVQALQAQIGPTYIPACPTIASGSQVITSSTAFNPPAGVTASCPLVARVIAVGGGGGGGSEWGGGGGGGRIATGTFAIASPVTVTIGGGGAAGVSNGNGGNGGTTSFGSFLVAAGGGGGAGNVVKTGGSGWTGGGGSCQGQAGNGGLNGGNGTGCSPGSGDGTVLTSSLFSLATLTAGAGGIGGSSTGDGNGGGGGGGLLINGMGPTGGHGLATTGCNGQPRFGGAGGNGYGAAGGGGSSCSGNGGAGAPGVVYVEW
jgi:hypothetical protein